jgi:type IV pilus assembly protein PilC
MPLFRYTARDSNGMPRSGEAQAADPGVLAAELRGRGWLVLEIELPVKTASVGDIFRWLNPLRLLPPTSFDTQIGLQQMAVMLRSGLTLLGSLRTVAEQSRRPSMAIVWEDVRNKIEEGSSLADAMEHHPRRFPSLVRQLVRAGEQAGALDNVLTRAAEHLERARALRLLVLNAVSYPIFVLLMAFAVTAYMVFSVMPKLQKFLMSRGGRLPAITQALLDVTNFLQHYYPYILGGGAVITLAFFMIYSTPPGRLFFDGFFLRVPIIGNVLRLGGTAIFARGLGLLVESGITLTEALRTTANLLTNRALSLRVERARDSVLQGNELAPGLLEGRQFMPMLGRMVAVGEQTGRLDLVLAEVARFHEEQLTATVKRLGMLLEPAMILIVGGIVGFVYIAFFVALFSLAGGR